MLAISFEIIPALLWVDGSLKSLRYPDSAFTFCIFTPYNVIILLFSFAFCTVFLPVKLL